jgi:3-oxoadipate enol-lactonase
MIEDLSVNIQIRNLSMAIDDCGSGTPMLLIHGFPLNRQMWQPQLQPLADAGYRVIAPDLRGFGASEATDTGYSMDGFADDMVALMDALDIERAVVCGMSMGGYVLMNMLERYPQRVTAACFIATRSTTDDETGRARRTAMAADAERLGANPIIKMFAELLFAPETSQHSPELIARATVWMRETNPRALAGALIGMRDRKDYTPLLPNFKLPSLVIAGAEDRAAPLEAAQLIAEGLPDAELKVIEHAGHMLNMEQPEQFNALLIQFLDKLKR